MKSSLYFIVLILYTKTTYSSIYNHAKEDVSTFKLPLGKSQLKHTYKKKKLEPLHEDTLYGFKFNRHNKEDFQDAVFAKSKARVLRKAKRNHKGWNVDNELAIFNDKKKEAARMRFQMDPVLNLLQRRSGKRSKRKRKEDISSSLESSSSREMKKWKDQWKEHWMQKKFEAINYTGPKGDNVNMVAARPWGVPCGDPNQHDMPWGTCMLPMECEAEYRIYRGDYFCGRTQFICCALQLTTYDMYQGFDVSFADSELSTDSEEKRNRGKNSKRKKKKRRERRKRRNERLKRKRKIKKNILKIIKEMRKILNKSYRNGTSERKRMTKRLKKFIKDLKKKYMKDRKAVKDIHEIEAIKIDAALQKRLNEIKGLNVQFLKNSTFRDILLNGTISKKGARMLVEAYPELSVYLNTRRNDVSKPKDYLDYDIEYGMLYY